MTKRSLFQSLPLVFLLFPLVHNNKLLAADSNTTPTPPISTKRSGEKKKQTSTTTLQPAIDEAEYTNAILIHNLKSRITALRSKLNRYSHYLKTETDENKKIELKESIAKYNYDLITKQQELAKLQQNIGPLTLRDVAPDSSHIKMAQIAP
ncbi:MAG: hypothetical protein RLZ12_426 [Bacillota bacterium]|jgi:predicted RNase H-like nuclease (RuvC/YqgF family)